jgi:small-conductance mechanosensitive channel
VTALIGLALFVVFWFVARLLRNLVRDLHVREHMRADAVTIATRVVYFALLVFGGLVAVGYATDSQNVTVIGVIGATVVASLGLQDILRNYVSGFYILFERNLKVGDTIEFTGKSGVVAEVKMRVTLLKAEDGSLVVVPNAELFNNVVTVRTEPAPPVRPRKRPG